MEWHDTLPSELVVALSGGGGSEGLCEVVEPEPLLNGGSESVGWVAEVTEPEERVARGPNADGDEVLNLHFCVFDD